VGLIAGAVCSPVETGSITGVGYGGCTAVQKNGGGVDGGGGGLFT